MVLDLITLGVFVLIMAIGMWKIVNGLKRDRRAGSPRCGGCGVEANQIEEFLCRTCRRDVRQYGLILPDGEKGNRTLGMCTGLTSMVAIVGIIATVIVGGITTQEGKWFTRHEFAVLGTDIDSIVLETEGSRTTLRVTGQLILKTGKTAVIDLAVPEMNCSLSESDGRVVSDHLKFDVQAVRQWFAMVGLDLGDSKIERAVEEVCAQMTIGFSSTNTPVRMNLLKPTNASSSLSSGGPPRWVYRTSLVLWPSVWLVGIYKLVLPRPRRRDVVVDEIALVK